MCVKEEEDLKVLVESLWNGINSLSIKRRI